MKIIQVLTLTMALLMSSCANLQRGLSNLVFPPNPYSDRRDGESVSITLIHGSDRDAIAKKKGAAGGGPRLVEPLSAAAVAGLALSQVQEFLKTEAEKYSATYSAAAASDIFYDDWTPNANINLRAIRLTRLVKKDPAADICFVVAPSLDNTAFRLFPANLQISRAKAKLIAFDWLAPFGFDLLAPWTVFQNDWKGFDNDVDLSVQIEVHGIWVGKDQVAHKELLAKQEVKFSAITLNREKGTSLLKTKRGDEVTCENLSMYKPDDINLPDNNTAFYQAIPRSQSSNLLGTGNYVVGILVTEYDQYGQRVKELGSKVETNKEGLTKALTGLFP